MFLVHVLHSVFGFLGERVVPLEQQDVYFLCVYLPDKINNVTSDIAFTCFLGKDGFNKLSDMLGKFGILMF